MPDAILLVLVFVGGFAGGVLRYSISGFVGRRVGETFPWGTVAVNGSGALAIGLLAAWVGEAGVPDALWMALVVGILGSYTTVSSFSLQTLALVRDGERLPALFNVVASLALCLGAAMVGYLAGMAVWG